jgi:REP element-mobilizing transposase RayT
MAGMPRTARASQGGSCYHVLNRGNGRQTVFHKDGDYAAFVKLLRDAAEGVPMRLLAYCLMPNHFHLALWPRGDGALRACARMGTGTSQTRSQSPFSHRLSGGSGPASA